MRGRSRRRVTDARQRNREQAVEELKPMMSPNGKLTALKSTNRLEAMDAVIVRLDPGLAFGSGTHPTTALCLQWLDGLDLQGKTVLDFGCGSGILALAALKLGAARAVGVDNDPQALLAGLGLDGAGIAASIKQRFGVGEPRLVVNNL